MPTTRSNRERGAALVLTALATAAALSACSSSGIITNTGTAVDLNEEVGAAVPRQTDNYYHVFKRDDGKAQLDLRQRGEHVLVQRHRWPEPDVLFAAGQAGEPAGRAVRHHPAPVDDGHPVTQPLGLFHEVGD